MKRIVIVCAGGQGVIVADILQRARAAGADAVTVGFLDDTPALRGQTIVGVPVLGVVGALRTIEHDAVIVAIGANRVRRVMTERLLQAGERLAIAIHPFASVSPSAQIGEGAMISAGALVLPRATLGRGVLLNTKASVDHDTTIGDFAHVSAGATVGANVRIGEEALIALGASVTSGRTVGARSIIGGGACVVRDVPDDVTAWGVPARITSDRRSEMPNQ